MMKTILILFVATLVPTTFAFGQSGDDSDGGGSADPNNPSAILTQFAVQNNITPETYDAMGYFNTLVLQPVLRFPVATPGLSPESLNLHSAKRR